MEDGGDYLGVIVLGGKIVGDENVSKLALSV
jgi:hypothetical protein